MFLAIAVGRAGRRREGFGAASHPKITGPLAEPLRGVALKKS
jgi:hypothetical protein